MPLTQMPNGEYVDIADGTPPEVVERIKKQFKGKRRVDTPVGTRVAARDTRRLTDEQREVIKRTDADKKQWGVNQYGAMDRIVDGITFNTMDNIGGAASAATRGVANAISKGDIGEIGKEYRVTRDTRNRLKREYSEENPWTSTIAEVGGSLLNPIGTGAKGVQAVGRALAKLPGLNRAGNAAMRVGGRMDTAGPVAKAIMAGGTTGTLNAAGASEDLENLPRDAIIGGLTGMAAGGVLGGLGQLGARGVQILKDRRPESAERVAYAKVADLLKKGDMSPEQAVRRIKVADARGGDAMVQDLTPGLSSEAGFLSREINLPSSNKLVDRGQTRWGARRGKIAEQVEGNAVLPPGMRDFDSLRQADDLIAGRKGKAAGDYAGGGALDNPIAWSKELDDFFKASPDADKLMQDAYLLAQRFGDDLGRIDPNGQAVPTMRVWNYLKRAFDGKIKMAYRAGDETTAAGYSNQLQRLKDHLGTANPEYQKVLAAQRDFYEQQKALEIGEEAFKLIQSKPRQALKSLRGLQGKEKDNARVGIVDSYINKILSADDPVAAIGATTRNEHQMELLTFAFGGKKEFGIFKRAMKREVAARDADKITRFGGQSPTPRMQQTGAAQGGDASLLAGEALAGGAFGGGFGVAANVGRKMRNMASGITEEAQEKIAQILLSKGEDLVTKSKEVAEYMARRKAGNQARGRWLGKAAQQPFTTEIGGE